ncbi:mechanosensitive ion channel family protein [Anthocerotibacter panamensis]|uniref:mechanosensitive ion channel family protein n=1 Tax=Anthocerotibacter panamensis TaxID=2857077 RepID=UPI001C408230|nr:mechanosensitive ion channel family protein [Anthocerotibacter panamensis]
MTTLDLEQWLQQNLSALWAPTLRITMIVLAGYLSTWLVDSLLRKWRAYVDDGDPSHVSDIEKRVETLSVILSSTQRVVVWGIVLVITLDSLGIPIAPLVASAGLVGVALGLGAQSVVKDLLVGFFILWENQYGVGDLVKVDTLAGVVERLDLRTTTLRDITGNVHIVPNGTIARVTVMSKEWSRALVDVRITYFDDLDQTLQLLQKVGQAMRQEEAFSRVILDDLQVLGVEDLSETGVVIRVLFKTQPGRQFEVMRELRRRIKLAFDQAGIYIPFPQRLLPLQPPAHSPEKDVS